MIIRYTAAALIVLGLGISAGAGSHDWFPLVAAQGGLGIATMASGYLFLTLINDDGDDCE